MAIRTLVIDTPLEDLFHERIFTLSALRAHPLGAPFVADYVKLAPDLQAMGDTQHARESDVADADALITRIEEKLAGLVLAISLALHAVVKGDKTSPLYAYYFPGTRPSEFKHAITARQLTILGGWVPSLSASTIATLKALGAELGPVLADADLAVKARDTAEQALFEFSNLGARKTFIDSFNSRRKDTHGALMKMPHDHPDLQLPLDFADGFFMHGTRAKPPTMAKLVARIEKTTQDLQLLQDQKAEMDAADAANAKAIADASAAADTSALAAAKKEAADVAKTIAALEAKLGTGAPTTGTSTATPTASSTSAPAPAAPPPTLTPTPTAPAPIPAPAPPPAPTAAPAP